MITICYNARIKQILKICRAKLYNREMTYFILLDFLIMMVRKIRFCKTKDLINLRFSFYKCPPWNTSSMYQRTDNNRYPHVLATQLKELLLFCQSCFILPPLCHSLIFLKPLMFIIILFEAPVLLPLSVSLVYWLTQIIFSLPVIGVVLYYLH